MALLLTQNQRTTHSVHLPHSIYPQHRQPQYPMPPPSGSSSAGSSVAPTPGSAISAAPHGSRHSTHSSFHNTPGPSGPPLSSPASRSTFDSSSMPAPASSGNGSLRQLPFGANHQQQQQQQHDGHASADATPLWNYNALASNSNRTVAGTHNGMVQTRPSSSEGLATYPPSSSASGGFPGNSLSSRPMLSSTSSLPNQISSGNGQQHYLHVPYQQPQPQVAGQVSSYDTSPHSQPQPLLPGSGLVGVHPNTSSVGTIYGNAGYAAQQVQPISSEGVRGPFIGEGPSHGHYQTHQQSHAQFMGGEGGNSSDYESNDVRREGGWNPFEVKHRRRTTKTQFRILEETFQRNPKPTNEVRKAISEQLDMPPRAVQIWFQNRRAKAKTAMKKAAAAAAAAGRHHHHAALLAKQEEGHLGVGGLAGPSSSPSDGSSSIDRRTSGHSGNSGTSAHTSISSPSDFNWRGASGMTSAGSQQRFPNPQISVGGFLDGRRQSLSSTDDHGGYATYPGQAHQYGQSLYSGWRSQGGSGTAGMNSSAGVMSGPSQAQQGYRQYGVGGNTQDLYTSPSMPVVGATHDDFRNAVQQHGQHQQHHPQPAQAGHYYASGQYDPLSRSWRHDKE